ncbi:hypothetical protein HMPREF1531_01319 [Propionibacterium sp. oral taxon 192 str. F0372]|uniref:FAD:protein FMN transferase n=1 Tax=Propionibacterium sp. oral taxon 192 TaxID=671222 RepID=UPI0003547E8C|nr:FAD:protein FMN transferase [Propionibacterium sp. oral taxon 192]EPH03260.1 hypothetical protein HMPREF1531_01319 [Propionibacterium sp. oral taxon 192 str. F0372]
MGTIAEVIVLGGHRRELLAACARELGICESLLSRFDPDSDISRLNAARGMWVEVDELTDEVLQTASRLATASCGAFTPLIGALVESWDVKGWLAAIAAGARWHPPDPAVVQQARRRTDPGLLEGAGGRWRLGDGAQLDLGGIAKGWVADRLRDLCIALGATSALVSIGTSSVATSGDAGDKPWRVGIQSLDDGIIGSIALRGQSLATSGDHLQRLPELVTSTVVHHVIDPRSGYPSASGVRQASVVCPNGAHAEVAATTLMVTGGLPPALATESEWVCLSDHIEVSPGLDIALTAARSEPR